MRNLIMKFILCLLVIFITGATLVQYNTVIRKEKEAKYFKLIRRASKMLRKENPAGVEMLEKATRLLPKKKEAYERIANAYYKSGDYEYMLFVSDKFIDNVPCKEAYLLRATAFLRLGDYNNAYSDLRVAQSYRCNSGRNVEMYEQRVFDILVQ